MSTNPNDNSKSFTNYRAKYPIPRREITEYSRGVASAYALEQTTCCRRYQFTCSSAHPVSRLVYGVCLKKRTATYNGKKAGNGVARDVWEEGREEAGYHFPRFLGIQENRPDTKCMQRWVTSMYSLVSWKSEVQEIAKINETCWWATKRDQRKKNAQFLMQLC